MNLQVKNTKQKDTLLYKELELKNGGKNISWKTIKNGYKYLLNNGYRKEDIVVRVDTVLGMRTVKGFDEDLENTLEDYFVNKVKDPKKFTNNFTSVSYGIWKEK
jgi:hypothetical protein